MNQQPIANVVPSRIAREQLGTTLERFRRGENEPLVFGAHRKPEAVILPYAEYLAFRAVMEERHIERALDDVDAAMALAARDEVTDPRKREVLALVAAGKLTIEQAEARMDELNKPA